ncbi:hypothetical protein F5890DRAFT_205569 [Lentinula detonsa]|uniref:Uncharacterized protein n=1 Tax=Lentinula detonsa TaxID=2804962 RepID=A0AA38UR11_9AGAR|nr:hypothetical protein F5890DRAFT_205569 [Lentinula detonsa]
MQTEILSTVSILVILVVKLVSLFTHSLLTQPDTHFYHQYSQDTNSWRDREIPVICYVFIELLTALLVNNHASYLKEYR